MKQKEEIVLSRHYININSSSDIITGWSDGPHPGKDISNAILLTSEGSYQFTLLGEENPILVDESGVYLYTYIDGEVSKKSPYELRVERAIALEKTLPSIKANLIEQSKEGLASYLKTHPLIWIDNKTYSVTKEKQALLAQQINLYLADSTATLYWNASGEESQPWPADKLIQLSKDIQEYVRPFVQYQQEKEIEINNAETVDEAKNISIDWAKVVKLKTQKINNL